MTPALLSYAAGRKLQSGFKFPYVTLLFTRDCTSARLILNFYSGSQWSGIEEGVYTSVSSLAFLRINVSRVSFLEMISAVTSIPA